MPTNDGWTIARVAGGWVARYLPNADRGEEYTAERGVFETKQEAIDVANGNYTTRGIVS